MKAYIVMLLAIRILFVSQILDSQQIKKKLARSAEWSFLFPKDSGLEVSILTTFSIYGLPPPLRGFPALAAGVVAAAVPDFGNPQGGEVAEQGNRDGDEDGAECGVEDADQGFVDPAGALEQGFDPGAEQPFAEFVVGR